MKIPTLVNFAPFLCANRPYATSGFRIAVSVALIQMQFGVRPGGVSACEKRSLIGFVIALVMAPVTPQFNLMCIRGITTTVLVTPWYNLIGPKYLGEIMKLSLVYCSILTQPYV